jgi:hypothetical protein
MWIAPKPNFAPSEQLRVYLEAYRLRLIGILQDDYEKTAVLLGAEFNRLAAEFVEEVKSTFYDASDYSWQFADWLLAHEPKAADMADFERKQAACFNLANTPAATNADFESLSAEEFAAANIAPRAASFLEKYCINIDEPTESGEFYYIIYRDGELVYRMLLEAPEFELLTHLKNGKTIGDALGALQTDVTPEQIQNWFARWVKNSILSLV